MFKLKFKQKMKPNFLLCLTLRRKSPFITSFLLLCAIFTQNKTDSPNWQISSCLLIDFFNLFLNTILVQEFIVSGVLATNNALRTNFDNMVGNSLNEFVVVGSE